MTQSEIIGQRIRRLREALGLRQKEFGERVGVSSGSISKLENGQMPVDANLLASIAQVLGCTPDYLSAPPRSISTTRPWLRAYADASKRAVDQYIADSEVAMDLVDHLGLKRIPDAVPVFDGDPNDDEAIEQFAHEVRLESGIEEGDVVGNAIRATERIGCIVLPMEDELGRHLGLSLRINGAPLIRVSRSSRHPDREVPGDRQRFTVVHELGHLALHSTCPPPTTSGEASAIEKQAHRFAAAFLLPAVPLMDSFHDLGARPTLNTLAALKETWGVSIKALVLRFQHLGVVDADQARSLYKQISARKWNKNEPVHVGNENAIWLERAIAKKVGHTNPIADVASSAGVSQSYFARWTEWAPTEAHDFSARILPLPTRSGVLHESGRKFESATITNLPRRY